MEVGSDARRIGFKVRTAREEQGIRLGDLAAKAGISRWTLRYIERGERRALGATLGRIARALDVPLSSLVEEARTDEISR